MLFRSIVPVPTVQVGCDVTDAVGAAGAVGAALIVALVAFDVQPEEFLAVTLYVPAATPVNTPVVFVYVVPSIL